MALGLRPWGVAVVGEHADLRARLLDSRAETSRQGCEWRYAALQVSLRHAPTRRFRDLCVWV